MSNKAKLFIVVALIALGVFSFIQFKKSYTPKYRWNSEYKRKDDQPYGCKLFYSYIQDRKEGSTLITNQDYSVLDTNLRNTSFISVGTEFLDDSVAAAQLINYVEKGNVALLAVDVSPTEVLRNFVPRGDSIEGFAQERDSMVVLDFPANDLPYPGKIDLHYKKVKDTTGYNWGFYTNEYFRDKLSEFGWVCINHFDNNAVNAFYVEHGKGKIIVHANPILFTNYYFVRESGFKHNNNMLSYLNTGHIYWDDPTYNYNQQSYGHHSNPLQFLFTDRRLKWAWYLFVCTILLYLVFRSKREQRIIPLMPSNSNSTIEYTKAIGTLYFQSKGHHHIATEMYNAFLADVRSRYYITTDIPEDQLMEQLAQRSGVDKTFLYHLLRQFKQLKDSPDSTADELIGLYNNIETYNTKRK